MDSLLLLAAKVGSIEDSQVRSTNSTICAVISTWLDAN
jgi:hypothetical protein